jgi:hypothetical protein
MNTKEYLHYRVGDRKTVNKLEAIEWANKDLSKVHFYFCDDVHSNYDWTKEPSASIFDLIDRKTIALRNKYDHICLWYSGGWDSHTILNSFIRTGCLIDEVVIFYKPWISEIVEHVFSYEHIKKIKNTIYPNLKINVVPISDKLHTNFYRKYKNDWIYHDSLNYFGYLKPSRSMGFAYQPDYLGELNSKNLTSNRVNIQGVEKPRVDLRHGKWYSCMPDVAVSPFIDAEIELFYMSPDATEIYIKQCWNAIKWFESFPQCSHQFVHDVQSQKNDLLYIEWNKAIGREDVYHPQAEIGFNKKFFSPGIGGIDSRIYEEKMKNSELETYEYYLKGLSYIKAHYKDIWTHEKGWPTLRSREIFIKDFEPSFNTKT